MNVSLTNELNKYIASKVKSGLYRSSSEVIRDSLRLLKERDGIYKQRLAVLKEDIKIGLTQASHGEVVDGEAAFDKISKRTKRFRGKKK